MRKNTARHWLHAVLDLLPVILIPVFMIYSHRHTIDSGSIEVPQNEVVDFNQLYQPQPQYSSSNHSVNYVLNEYSVFIDGQNDSTIPFALFVPTFQFDINHKYLLKGGNYNADLRWDINLNTFTADYNSRTLLFDIQNNSNSVELYYYVNTNNYITVNFNFNIFDLTKMFGVGNEPTIEQFNQWYTADYYDYILSRKELLKGYTTVTYDDTDIMSQSVYQLYNSVDKYFNMGNVFGMSNVYDWFNLNIFSGQAPISIYIVWNIVLYEFVMDLLFLLYALFMWFIDVTKRLIEKPLDSIK